VDGYGDVESEMYSKPIRDVGGDSNDKQRQGNDKQRQVTDKCNRQAATATIIGLDLDLLVVGSMPFGAPLAGPGLL